MRNIRRNFELTLFAAGLGIFSALAHAEHHHELVCGGTEENPITVGDALNDVASAIESAHFEGKKAATNQSNLQTKLVNADAKIAGAKYPDAVDKLSDISDTATALANAQQPKLGDAQGINEAVAAAIVCVTALIKQ